ncbi:AMP-binding protein [Thiomonas sp. FB-6]|uniref:AMP-binding protein n=1 Tax=Thiomonas sp. FB-6 TaxID=1158291 RepID=UPI00037E5639|nr:AMP-binding protein [Thiomonas sp. FB-6]
MSDSPSAQAFLQARDFLLRHRSDYETAYAGFRWPRLEHFNWALDYFDPMARGNPSPALWIVDEQGREDKLSFDQMARRSSQVANWLRGLGVRRGDRVLLLLPNEVALWECMLACIKLGAVIVPTTTLVSVDDLRDRFERGAVRHVICSAAAVERFAEFGGPYTRIVVGGQAPGWQGYEASLRAAEEFVPDGATRAEDPLLLYFTSGTTSRPKLVLHSHQSYPVGHLSTMYWIGLRPGDVHWNISSPGWAKHAWSCFFAPWNAGATVFIFNYARFDACAVLDALRDRGVSSLCAPPTVWRMLILQDLERWKVSLRELVGAGEPLNPEVIESVRRAWGITIRDGYGQTETTAIVGNTPGQPVKPGSMGRPLPGYRVVLLDVDERPAADGEVSLALDERPLGLMLGYEGQPDKTAEACRGGNYHTSDVASRDADGYLSYVGRSDDVFKASDYRISPFELESVLIEHDAVAEAAVVPAPDPIRAAVPKAVVALRAGVAPSRELALDILRFARERLAPYKRIRVIEFAELPKTLSGKIRRVELRKLELGREPGETRELEFREED